jgi:hypothetical protein
MAIGCWKLFISSQAATVNTAIMIIVWGAHGNRYKGEITVSRMKFHLASIDVLFSL